MNPLFEQVKIIFYQIVFIKLAKANNT